MHARGEEGNRQRLEREAEMEKPGVREGQNIKSQSKFEWQLDSTTDKASEGGLSHKGKQGRKGRKQKVMAGKGAVVHLLQGARQLITAILRLDACQASECVGEVCSGTKAVLIGRTERQHWGAHWEA